MYFLNCSNITSGYGWVVLWAEFLFNEAYCKCWLADGRATDHGQRSIPHLRHFLFLFFIQTADFAFEFQVRNTFDKLNLNLVGKNVLFLIVRSKQKQLDEREKKTKQALQKKNVNEKDECLFVQVDVVVYY